MPTPQYLLKQVHIDENENISLSNVRHLLHNNTIIPTQLPDISDLESFVVQSGKTLPNEADIIKNILEYKSDEVDAFAINDAYWHQFVEILSISIENHYDNNKQNYMDNAVQLFFEKNKLNNKDKEILCESFYAQNQVSNHNFSYDVLFNLTHDFNYIGSYIWLNGKNIHSQIEIDDVIQEKINELVFNEFELIADVDVDLNINLKEKTSLKP